MLLGQHAKGIFRKGNRKFHLSLRKLLIKQPCLYGSSLEYVNTGQLYSKFFHQLMHNWVVMDCIYTATPPNEPHQCILTHFNNCNFSKVQIVCSLMIVLHIETCRSFFIIIIIYLSWSWATCWPVPVSRIQKSLQNSAMIPSASWEIVFHYPG